MKPLTHEETRARSYIAEVYAPYVLELTRFLESDCRYAEVWRQPDITVDRCKEKYRRTLLLLCVAHGSVTVHTRRGGILLRKSKSEIEWKRRDDLLTDEALKMMREGEQNMKIKCLNLREEVDRVIKEAVKENDVTAAELIMNPPERREIPQIVSDLLEVFCRLTKKISDKEREEAQRKVERLCGELLSIWTDRKDKT